MLILGVGNSFRGDDAAGLLAARQLREKLPQATITECEGDLSVLMDRWSEQEQVIVIDAVSSGAAAGTVHRLDAAAEPLDTRFFRGSTHALGVAELVELSRALGRLPNRLVLYGIEGTAFAPGAVMSPAVAAGVDAAVKLIVEEATRHA